MKLRRFLNLSKLIGGFVSIVGLGISLALTINLAVQVFATGTSNDFWVVLGVAVGMVFNVAEVGCFIRWKKNDEPVALALGIVLGLVSVSASVGALQISLEKGAMQSTAYTQKLREIEFIDKQIGQYQGTADRQRDINYLTASGRTLDKATNLLEDRRQAQTELSTIQTQGAGLNAALYRAYAKLLGVEVLKVAIWLNVALSLLIEITFLYFTVVSVKADEEESGLKNFDEKAIKAYLAEIVNENGGDGKTGNRESIQNPAIDARRSIGFQVGESLKEQKGTPEISCQDTPNEKGTLTQNEPELKGTLDRSTPGVHVYRGQGTLTDRGTPEFSEVQGTPIQKGTPNDEGTPEGTLKSKGTLEKNSGVHVHPETGIDPRLLALLLAQVKREGKSDALILELKKQGYGYKKIGKLAGEILKRPKRISPTYVKRVIQRNEGGV